MELKAKVEGQMAEILTPEALAFVEKLVCEFEPTRAKLSRAPRRASEGT